MQMRPHFHAVLLLLSFVVVGCLSKPALQRQTFLFESLPPGTAPPANGAVIALRAVAVAAPFSRPEFVYRTGTESYETDAYAGFLVAPDAALALAIRAQLLGSGRFRDVLERGSSVRPDKVLDVAIGELYGDFSRTNQAAAVLSMRLTLFAGGDVASRQPIRQKDYSRRVPLRENTAVAVMAGWDAALREILREAAAEFGE